MRDVIAVNQSVYFTVAAVARILDRSRVTVRRWVESGVLRASKPGRHLLVKQGELLRFVRHSRDKRDFAHGATERIKRRAREASRQERKGDG